MKKKLVILLTAALAAGLVIGCGKGEPNGEAPSSDETVSSSGEEGGGESVGSTALLKDIKVEDYVTLGVYKGMDVAVTPKGSVDDSELDSLVEQVYFGSITAENGGVMDRAVEEGDTVYIDYVGKKDDVAFEGGTASNSPLTIGSNTFIEGFEVGLIGVMPGETVDLNLTFPEGYGNKELAGQEVVFTVTVNYILPTEMKDEVVAAWGDEEYSNLEELRQYAYEYLEESNAYEYEVNLENAVLNQFMNNCEFQEMPRNIVVQYENNIRMNIENAAAMNGVDADTYTGYYYNTTLDGFIETYALDSVKQSIAFQAVANAENLNINDEELDEMLLEYALSAGYASVEEYIDIKQRESYREYFMFDKVINYLIDNAVISS